MMKYSVTNIEALSGAALGKDVGMLILFLCVMYVVRVVTGERAHLEQDYRCVENCVWRDPNWCYMQIIRKVQSLPFAFTS